MPPPSQPRIYHIVHLDRLGSIVRDGHLLSDAQVTARGNAGTTIGMNKIKQRRMTNMLTSHPDLAVGACVPFYFCPRSVMLYVISCRNHSELAYQGGQEPIVHLDVDLHAAVSWADRMQKRWAFTLSNAGASYFEDRDDLGALGQIDWDAVQAHQWRDVREAKQAEFLVEEAFSWTLVERIGVFSNAQARLVEAAIAGGAHRPRVEVKRDWYY